MVAKQPVADGRASEAGSDAKRLLHLAGPLAAAQVAQMAMQATDTYMISDLGLHALGTGALAGVIIYNCLVFFMGLLSGFTVLLARFHGAEQPHEVTDTLYQGLYVSLVLTAISLTALALAPALLLRIGQDPALVESTGSFLRTLMVGLPAALVLAVVRDFLAVVGHPRVVMLVTIAAVPLNALLNYLLIHGKLGLPALGVDGSALSTSIVRWLTLAVLIGYVLCVRSLRTYGGITAVRPLSWRRIGEACRIGWPIGLVMGLEITMFSVSALMLGYFGSATLAAHQIVIQWTNIVFTMSLGLSQATGILVAEAMGASALARARRVAKLGVALGTGLGMALALAFVLGAKQLAGFFIDPTSPETAQSFALCVKLLAFGAALQLIDGVQVILNGVLRGLKDTFVPMVLSAVAYCGVGLVVGSLGAFTLGLGSQGVWWGLLMGVGVSMGLLLYRCRWQFARLGNAGLSP